MYYLQIRLMERIKDTLKPLTWSSIAPPPSTPLNSVRSSKYSVAHGAPNRHFLPLLALSLPFLFNFDRQLSLWRKYCHFFQETFKAFILTISQILTCIMFNGDEMQSFAIVIAELSPVKKDTLPFLTFTVPLYPYPPAPDSEIAAGRISMEKRFLTFCLKNVLVTPKQSWRIRTPSNQQLSFTEPVESAMSVGEK